MCQWSVVSGESKSEAAPNGDLRDTFLFEQNYTRTPGFPTTGAPFQAVWRHTYGTEIDGIISIDPLRLARLVTVIGPFTLAVLLRDSSARLLRGYPTPSPSRRRWGSRAFRSTSTVRDTPVMTQGCGE